MVHIALWNNGTSYKTPKLQCFCPGPIIRADFAVVWAENLHVSLTKSKNPTLFWKWWHFVMTNPFYKLFFAKCSVNLGFFLCCNNFTVHENWFFFTTSETICLTLSCFDPVIFLSPHVVSQRSIDFWVGSGSSWIHWILVCGAVGTYAGGRKSETLSPWYFQSCFTDVRLGLVSIEQDEGSEMET